MENILENFKSIDITDKTILQEQFNYSRKEYYDCINSMDDINKKISDLKKEMMEISVELYSDPNITTQHANIKLKGNEDYQRISFEINCYERSLSIIEEKLNFIKSDIRILTNSMYNKF